MSRICWWTSCHCIQHNGNSMYAGPTKAIARSLLNKSHGLRNEELSFVKEFRYLGHVMTADYRDDKDIENNSGGKTQLAICWSGSSYLHQWRQKSNYSSYIVTQYPICGCALWLYDIWICAMIYL